MENFDLGTFDLNEHKDPGEISMNVSPICHGEDGTKYAFVSFSDGERTAEGRIPSCCIEKNDGFASIEVKELEKYMQQNLKQLKKMAASVNPLKAIMK